MLRDDEKEHQETCTQGWEESIRGVFFFYYYSSCLAMANVRLESQRAYCEAMNNTTWSHNYQNLCANDVVRGDPSSGSAKRGYDISAKYPTCPFAPLRSCKAFAGLKKLATVRLVMQCSRHGRDRCAKFSYSSAFSWQVVRIQIPHRR